MIGLELCKSVDSRAVDCPVEKGTCKYGVKQEAVDEHSAGRL